MSWRCLWVLALSFVALHLGGCNECESDGECDDGLFCSGAEQCRSGSCVPGTPRACDDGIACTVDSCDEEGDQCLNVATDADEDGFFAPGCGGEDCDDGDTSVHPGADEACDGVDNDCNGAVEEDDDGDGFFDELFCPEGDDCDDDDPQVFPGAVEVCDGVDNNCLLGTDDEADTDEDGYTDITCGGDDCDDEVDTRNPGAAELCNGEDDDCDGSPDDGFPCVMGELYECLASCGSIGVVECPDDCILPEGSSGCEPPEEVCNGLDDDCDGVPDNGFDCSSGELVTCLTPCGSEGQGACTSTCESPAPEVCIPPVEVCNGADDDCNGVADEVFACAAGTETDCVTECDTFGTGTCGLDCQPPLAEACTKPAEVCNDLVDNDCDLDVDCTDFDCIGDPSCI